MRKSKTSKKNAQIIDASTIILISIFIAAIILRFWKVPEFFSFNFDEEYQASLAATIVKDFHLIWIGVSASNVGYYLGPGFTYLNALLFWISKGDPIILGYFSSFLGIITIASIYFVTKNLFSKKAALFAAAFYGFSALIIYYDRRFWNPTPIPLIAVLMVYSLSKTRENTKWLIFSSALIAISLHVHLSLTLFWPLIMYVFIKNAKRIILSTWIASIAVFMLITSPMLVFDFVHNFDNLLAPIRFFQEPNDPNHILKSTTTVNHFFDFLSSAGRLWFIKFFTNVQEEQNLGAHGLITRGNIMLALFSLAILSWTAFKAIIQTKYRVLFFSLAVLLLGFIFYPGVAGEYYLLAFFGLFSISVGIFMEKIPTSISIVIITIFLLSNCLTIFTSTQEKYGLTTRKKLVKEIMSLVNNKSFYLETVGNVERKYHPYGGWRYLFKAYGRAPNQSHADEFFGWLYPDEISKIKPQLRVIISEEKELKYEKDMLGQLKSGAYYAYVVKNN